MEKQQDSIWTNTEHHQWWDLSQRNTKFVERLTGRQDTSLHIIPRKDGEAPAAAWWVPSTATMEIDANHTLDTDLEAVDHINLFSRHDQEDNPLLIASIFHEAGHARFTTHHPIDFKEPTGELAGKKRQLLEIVTMLEEPRIEARLLGAYPQYRKFLKAMVFNIVAPAILVKGDFQYVRMGALNMIFLLGGRIASGSIPENDPAVVAAIDAIKGVMGDDTYKELFDLVSEGVENANTVEEIQDVAERILMVLREQMDDDDLKNMANSGFGMSCSGGQDGQDGQDGQGGGSDGQDDEMTDAEKELAKSMAKAFEELNKKAEEYAQGGDYDKGSNDKKDVNPAQKERAETEEYAKQVAATNLNRIPGIGGVGYGGSSYGSRIVEVAPRTTTQEYARIIKRSIEKAQFREVDRTRVKSMVPPGRLRIGEAMRLQRQVKMNHTVDAVPWSQNRRRNVERPPINLAVLPDFSGSLSTYQTEIAEYAWAFSTAVRNLKGQSTVVAWDGDPLVTMEPHRTYSKVRVANNGGTSEGLPEALLVADKLANLTFGEGVRFLVVITDNQLPNGVRIKKSIDQMVKHGVKVLWVGIELGSNFGNTKYRDFKLSPDVTYVKYVPGQPFSETISKPLIKALADA